MCCAASSSGGHDNPPHGYLLVDEANFPVDWLQLTPFHVFSRYGVQVDGYAWTATPATTLGRCPDGTGDFVVTSAPTRGTTNTCAKTRRDDHYSLKLGLARARWRQRTPVASRRPSGL